MAVSAFSCLGQAVSSVASTVGGAVSTLGTLATAMSPVGVAANMYMGMETSLDYIAGYTEPFVAGEVVDPCAGSSICASTSASGDTLSIAPILEPLGGFDLAAPLEPLPGLIESSPLESLGGFTESPPLAPLPPLVVSDDLEFYIEIFPAVEEEGPICLTVSNIESDIAQQIIASGQDQLLDSLPDSEINDNPIAQGNCYVCAVQEGISYNGQQNIAILSFDAVAHAVFGFVIEDFDGTTRVIIVDTSAFGQGYDLPSYVRLDDYMEALKQYFPVTGVELVPDEHVGNVYHRYFK
jgi:hypothetical protein